MTDFIQLLPDSLANQIAAGEVVQRPASVVKELLENAVDAGANNIQVQVEDAGKKLIQVVDNGKGMSDTDLRMAFERHATSKINQIDDLYNLHTLGFRGEALASIAAVSLMETKTKPSGTEVGNHLVIEGSDVKNHEPIHCGAGTAINVKNLFYNTPARKNFLKSHNVEYRHIIEEFCRVALAHPEIQFTLKNAKETVYYLKTSTLKQRIIQLFGKKYEQALVPVEEETKLFSVSGFIGKPDFARKTRGDQYFFVNNRFIKSPYLNHAVFKAYEGLLAEGHHPLYILFFQMEPQKIDVNVHPTKSEVKFEDEQSIYAILKPTIKRALSEYHISPALDFERNPVNPFEEISNPKEKLPIQGQPGSNEQSIPSKSIGENQGKPASQDEWTSLYEVLKDQNPEKQPSNQPEEQKAVIEGTDQSSLKNLLKIQDKFICTPIQSGLIIIHQNYARQRILYENYLEALSQQSAYSQQQLFPEVIELKPTDKQLVDDLLPDIKALGFEIEEFGKYAYLVNGLPADLEVGQVQPIFEQLLEDYKHNQKHGKLERKDNLARSLALNAARKKEANDSPEGLQMLIDKLFACEMPYYTPGGKPVFISISHQDLDKKFEKS